VLVAAAVALAVGVIRVERPARAPRLRPAYAEA
jgi:hypothetical protein